MTESIPTRHKNR